jgi:hypothetical protein
MELPNNEQSFVRQFADNYNCCHEFVMESYHKVRTALLTDLGNVCITDAGHYAFAPLNEEMTEWKATDGVVIGAQGLLEFLWNNLDSGTHDAFCNWDPEDFATDHMSTLTKEQNRQPLNFLPGLGS